VAGTKDLTDPAMREAIAEAERALDEGDYTESVRKSAVAFLAVIGSRPDLIVKPVVFNDLPLSGRGPLPARGPWPDLLGVTLHLSDDAEPEVTFEKERFTMSEAVTYFEYALDTALRAERSPAG
jgi:hypothetical protein